jgi:hypothetical protein
MRSGRISARSTPRALTGEFAAFILEATTAGLRPGVEGWVDDDYALLAPWGFDVGSIAADVLVWQGDQDLMVPLIGGFCRGRVVPCGSR